ncbi:cell surface polysaccharide biosynthesis / Chain length determinant protein [marine actinobacterium PHSC20C1]|nr:cell surface polysaccharide biosynthesis / Chain length determinant protein [marine actinobacterium PHSC20C1]
MEDLSYLEIFRQRWLAILIAVVVGVGSAALVAFSIPPTYTATATLFLAVKDTNATLAERSQFSLARVNSYTALVRSSNVLQPVIDDLGLDMTVQELSRQVTASNPNSTVNINISAQASSGESAAVVANAVADSLSRLVAKVENFGTFSVSLDRLIPALAPVAPSAPQKNVILGLGLISGLAGGAIIALLMARFDHRIRRISDVRRASGLAVLGAIPRMRRREMLAETEPAHDVAIADAVLRITQANGGSMPRMLLLVPAGQTSGPGHGRLGIAGAIAATGRTTTLVETEQTTDTSSPFAEYAENEGLAELLTGSTTLPKVTRALGTAGAFVVPAGVALPTEVQSEESIRAVMSKVLYAADVVIVQATPSSLLLSVPVVAPYADVSIVVVRYNHSTDIDLAQAVSQLRIAGVRPIGALLVDVPPAKKLDLLSTWLPEDFAAKPAKARITPRRKTTKPATAAAKPVTAAKTSVPSKPAAAIKPPVAKKPKVSTELVVLPSTADERVDVD